MSIGIYNRQKDLPLSRAAAKSVVLAVLEHLCIRCEEVSLYFVTEKAISDLHAKFFQDPSSTDCISFPLGEGHLGEVFVCPAQAKKFAKARGLDPYEETTLYIVHGILHLAGHDDLEPKARAAMRKKEKSCMRWLKEKKVALRPR